MVISMKPILFNTEMVKAILEDRKTVTRRIIKPQPKSQVVYNCGVWQETEPCANGVRIYTPPYAVGEVLYVRETWCDPSPEQCGWPILYKADMPMHWDAKDTEIGEEATLKAEDYKWRPSIHMPKEAARIFLRVKAVSIERLQHISEAGAVKEGCAGKPCERTNLCSSKCTQIWRISPRTRMQLYSSIWAEVRLPTAFTSIWCPRGSRRNL